MAVDPDDARFQYAAAVDAEGAVPSCSTILVQPEGGEDVGSEPPSVTTKSSRTSSVETAGILTSTLVGDEKLLPVVVAKVSSVMPVEPPPDVGFKLDFQRSITVYRIRFGT